jgi:outer membrane protein OmpA-like peptidoglycan-associated protein
MKILLFGFLAFLTWSALSTYIYVCKIKGLCNEPITKQPDAVSQKETVANDTFRMPLVQVEAAAIPKDLMIYFAFDKSEFNSDTAADRYFDESNAYLGQNAQARLNITGYTDAIGSLEYNQALGYRRAQRVKQYFESRGIPANTIIIESRGEKEPADDNNTPEGRANNRRTSITIKK